MKNRLRSIAILILLLAKTGFAYADVTATISGSASVCQYSNSPFVTFTGNGGVSPYVFTYKINSGADVTVQTAADKNSVSVAVPTELAGVFTYTLVSVRDTSKTAVAQSGSVGITVSTASDASLNGTGSGKIFNGIPSFIIYNNTVSQFTFTNASTTTAANKNYKISWGDGTPDFSTTSWSSTTHTYDVGLWNLTYTIENTNGCTTVKSYIVFVGSNPAVSLGNPGNTDICSGSTLTFPITGTENNPPGTTYKITFNDGSSSVTYTHPAPASVNHTFTKSSCNTTSSGFKNSFSAVMVAENPAGSSQVSVVPIYVSTPPVAGFSLPATVSCANTAVAIASTTTGGTEATSSTCVDPSLIWTITPSTGVTLASGSFGNDFGSTDHNLWTKGSTSISPKFSIPGTYTIKLKAGSRCGTDEIQKTICIDAPLATGFTLDTKEGCAPLAVKATNITDISASCAAPTYLWQVTYSAGYCGTTSSFAFTNNTTSATVSPSFLFNNPGTYTVKLTATNSCGAQTSTQTIIVKKPPTVSINVIANGCGTASVKPTAVVNSCAPIASPLTYEWSFPGGTPAASASEIPGTIEYSKPGKYAVTLKVTNECGVTTSATQVFSVNRIPVLTNSALEQTICSGHASDAVVLTADTAATFSWSAVATAGITGFTKTGTSSTIPSQTISTTASSSGTVTYTIIPSTTGCACTPVSYVIHVNPAPTFSLQPKSSIVCQNGAADTLSVAVVNAEEIPAYQWYSNSVSSVTGGTLIPGATESKYVAATSAIGTTYYYCVVSLPTGVCTSLTSTVASVVVNAIPAITAQPTASQSLCVGGSITTPLSIGYSGGAGSASFQWYSSSNNTTVGGTPIAGANKATFTPPVFNTTGVNYFYAIVSFSGSGCGTLVSDTARIVVVSDPVIVSQPKVSQTLCQNSLADSLKVSVSGGIGSYNYQWYRNGVNNTALGTLISGATNGFYLPPTTSVGTTYYYCIVTQPNGIGCSVTSNTAAVVVNLSPSITKQPQSATYCEGSLPNTLTVEYANGVGTPSYQWFSNAANNNSSGVAIFGQTSSQFTPPALIGTVYYYCVISLPTGGCATMTSNTASITINPIPKISAKSDTICSGDFFTVLPVNNSFDVVPNGTNYKWTLQSVTPSGAVNGATSQSVLQSSVSQQLVNTTTAPAIVKYAVTPVSLEGCTGAPFDVSIRVNPAISVSVKVTNITCFGANNGVLDASVTGGVPFNSGNAYKIKWSGPNGFSDTTKLISNLTPGVYHLSILDGGGCPFAKDYTVSEPLAMALKTDKISDITCFGANNGAIAITVSGGTGKYHYTWTKDGLPFSSSEDLINLAPGLYRVSVTDDNNCGPQTASYTIVEPAQLSISLDAQTNVLCYGDSTGTVSVSASGGTKNEISPGVFDYIYRWTGPGGFQSKSRNLTNIKAGDYLLTVTDKEGCSNTLNVKITQPSEIVIGVTTRPVTCYGANNATIKLDITGGNAPYKVVWDNFAEGLYQENVSAGNYTITVTDAIGCVKTKTIVIAEAPIFTITPVVKNVSCYGAKDGSITLNFQGGKAPVTLKWSDGAITGTTRNNIGPGSYTVTISDGTPCFINKTFVIVEPQPLVVSARITHALDCNNANSGAVKLQVAGGTPPYNYQWSNGSSIDSLVSLTAGNYLVTVTDANGCTATQTYEVKRPEPLDISVSTTVLFDCTTLFTKYRFTADVTGGVPPYQLVWSSGLVSGSNGEVMETTESGLVAFEVTDSRGCVQNYTFNVKIAKPGIDYLLIDCNSHKYQFNAVQPVLDSGLETYLWDFGDGNTSASKNPIHIFAKDGNYIVKLKVTNATCTTSYQQKLVVEAVPTITLDRLPKLCEGDSVIIFAKGADSYQWSDGSTGDSIVIRNKGDYSVIGTTKAGCSSTLQFSVSYFELNGFAILFDRESLNETNPTLHLWSENVPFSQYNWDFGDGQTGQGQALDHTFDVAKEGYYDVKLRVVNPNGCIEKATKRIWITNSSQANTFTPNGDGVNDIFMKGWHLKIYNRNGLLLYEGVEGWDGTYKGKQVAPDTYFFVMDYMSNVGAKVKTGFVTVIR